MDTSPRTRKMSDHFKQNNKSNTVAALLEKYFLATRSSTDHESPRASVTATVALPPLPDRSTSPDTAAVVSKQTSAHFDRSRTTATQQEPKQSATAPLPPQPANKGLHSPQTGPKQDLQRPTSTHKPKQVPCFHKQAAPHPSPVPTRSGGKATIQSRRCTQPRKRLVFTTYYGGFTTSADQCLHFTHHMPFRPYRSDRYFYKSHIQHK